MYGVGIEYFMLLWLSRQSVALVRRRPRVQIPLAAYYYMGNRTSRDLFSGSFFAYNVFIIFLRQKKNRWRSDS